MFVKASIVCLLVVAVYADVSSLGSREYLPPKPTTSGYGYPTPSKPFPPPTQPPYRPPVTQPPYRPPVTNPPYRPPVTQPPYRPPVTQPPYRPPVTNPPYQPPTYQPTPPPYRPPATPTPTYGPPPPNQVPGASNPQGGRVPGPGEPGHVHIPGAPYDFNYAVKDDHYGTDFSHNAVSDGDQVKGEWRVLMPDGRTQIVTYIADWATGFHPQIRYEGEIKAYQPQASNQGYNYQKPNQPQQPQGNDGYRY